MNKKQTVEIIASGYEWICPKCDSLNKDIEVKESVKCEYCHKEFKTGYPRHAFEF